MKKYEVLNSICLKKRFCKDFNLPISLYDNPYFFDRLITLNRLFDCVEKFDIFCSDLTRFNNEQEYFEKYNSVKDEMITYIKSQPSYIEFINTSFSCNNRFTNKNLYSEENDGFAFISIDMKKANYSALHFFAPEIFDSCNTWENFVEKFTDMQHIIKSKYIRQVVLGACNPKKQITYEKYLMDILAQHLVKELDVDIYSLSNDEILIKVDHNFDFPLAKLREVVSNCQDGIGNLVRVEMFELNKIKGTDGWTKTYYCHTEEKIDFKCLNSEIFHVIVKYYFEEKINDEDLIFYHDGKLAKFLSPINNPWESEHE